MSGIKFSDFDANRIQTSQDYLAGLSPEGMGFVNARWTKQQIDSMSQINHSSATPLVMVKNTVYNARLASGTTPCGFTLPLKAAWSTGDWVMMTGLGSAGWTVGRGDNDAIIYNGGNSATSVSSNNQYDCAFFYCTGAGQINVTWFTPSQSVSNPSNNLYWAPNEFIQNGVAANGSAVITGLGTSNMYVGMSLVGSTFPTITIVSIDSDTQITVSGTSSYTGSVSLTFSTDRQGSDTTGTGLITKPFATYEKARTRALELGAGQGNPFNLIFLGNSADLVTFVISPYVNIDFNNALVTFASLTPDGRWEDNTSIILIQNAQITSSINLDFTTVSPNPTQKQILFRNVYVQDGTVNWSFTGNGNEFFCMTGDTAVNAFTCYSNTLNFTNFNLQLDFWFVVNNPITITANTDCKSSLLAYITQDVFGGINIVTVDGSPQNTLQPRACIIEGSIDINGPGSIFRPDTVSNLACTLSNGGIVDDSDIKNALWPMAAATAAPGFVAGPGGAVVLSGVPSLDNFSSFTTNSNYGIPQPGQYEFEYMAQISVIAAGNFDVNLYLSGILPSDFVDEDGNQIATTNGDGEPIVATTDYANSIVREQATVTTSFKKTLCGSITLDLPITEQIFLLLQNNGDMDVTVDNATWTIKRIY